MDQGRAVQYVLVDRPRVYRNSIGAAAAAATAAAIAGEGDVGVVNGPLCSQRERGGSVAGVHEKRGINGKEKIERLPEGVSEMNGGR